jgi:hypothetical protein
MKVKIILGGRSPWQVRSRPSKDLVLHLRDPHLAAQLDQLLTLTARHAVAAAFVDIGSGRPTAQATVGDSKVPADLGHGLLA